MKKEDWGNPKRLWGIEPRYESGRMIDIYLAIKDLPVLSVVDIACGHGIVLDGLWWKNQHLKCEQFDIEEYPEWKNLDIKPTVADLMEFIKTDRKYDLVMFLNSYRNWDGEQKEQFDEWIKRNAKYFITSNPIENVPSESWSVIGRDAKGYELKLYEI